MICIGNPDPWDRTNKKSKERTGFLPYNVSVGAMLGVKGDGVTRSGTLGPLLHGCWTYWGHSGGPICDLEGRLVGMHNSWDSKTGTRRGMTVLSVREALARLGKLERK